jgi:hypothetical protein
LKRLYLFYQTTRHTMNKSTSYPEIYSHFPVNNLRKSKSLNDINEKGICFESFFEGDGPLGICFMEKDEGIIVERIVDGTVASETFGLSIGMILTNVNHEKVEGIPFNKVMKKLARSWFRTSTVFLEFKKNVNTEIWNLLDSINYLEYYEKFIELGAKEKKDFEFVEYDDLIRMGIVEEKIKDFTELNTSILYGM